MVKWTSCQASNLAFRVRLLVEALCPWCIWSADDALNVKAAGSTPPGHLRPTTICCMNQNPERVSDGSTSRRPVAHAPGSDESVSVRLREQSPDVAAVVARDGVVPGGVTVGAAGEEIGG